MGRAATSQSDSVETDPRRRRPWLGRGARASDNLPRDTRPMQLAIDPAGSGGGGGGPRGGNAGGGFAVGDGSGFGADGASPGGAFALPGSSAAGGGGGAGPGGVWTGYGSTPFIPPVQPGTSTPGINPGTGPGPGQNTTGATGGTLNDSRSTGYDILPNFTAPPGGVSANSVAVVSSAQLSPAPNPGGGVAGLGNKSNVGAVVFALASLAAIGGSVYALRRAEKKR
jgi:hypothetical protein